MQKNQLDIEIYSVVHDIEGISPGLYKNTHLITAGNLRGKVGFLCINQPIARDCAVTRVFRVRLVRLSNRYAISRICRTESVFIEKLLGSRL